jgi:transcriptional regulator
VYIPEAFRETDRKAIYQLMRQNSFATLITINGGVPLASHLPILVDSDRGDYGTLSAHMARANPQWRDFGNGHKALAIFQGPHAYVSPSWYETHPSVPTWNYAVVHAYGTARPIDDRSELRKLLQASVQFYESGFEKPWTFDLPEKFVKKMMDMIVGFEIPISRIEGKFKLSQNRSPADRNRVERTLENSADPLAKAVAELMAAARGAR